MDFQDYASKESSAALLRALTESSENARQRLQAFRSAIGAATKALESALTTPQQIEVTELVARLAKAASAETEAAVQRASADAKAAAQRVAAETKTAADALQAQLKAALKEKESLSASLAESRVKADELRLELDTNKERIENARRELFAAREAQKKSDEALKKLEAAQAEAAAARDKEARARAAAEGELQKLREAADKMRADGAAAAKAIDAARAEKAKLEEAVHAATSQAQAADAKLNAVTSLFKASATRVKVLERADEEQQATIKELEEKLAEAQAVLDEKVAAVTELQDTLAAVKSVQVQAADREAATALMMQKLVDGFHALAGAATIAEALTAMMKGLAREFTRVAVFRVKGNKLEGQEQVGFDGKTNITKVVMPLGMDSLLTRAVNSGAIEQLTGADLTDSSRAPFGGKPTCALALPVVVHGESLGILYADDAGSKDSISEATHVVKGRFADALLQHTVSVLMRLTTELRTLAELRAYADSLLSEMEQMYLSDVSAGKSGAELQKRLEANLEYARSIYANRIALECPAAATLLDDQLFALADAQHGTPFGRDLAKVAGRTEDGKSRRTAS